MAQQILEKKTGNNSFMTRHNVEEHDFYPTPDYATEALLERECFEGGNMGMCLRRRGNKQNIKVKGAASILY